MIKGKSALILTMFFLLAGGTNAQLRNRSETKIENLFTNFYSDAVIFFEDAWLFYSSPLRFSGEDWLKAGALTGTNYFILTMDDKLHEQLAGEYGSTNGVLMWDITRAYGVVEAANIACIAAYPLAHVIGSDELREWSITTFEALSYSGAAALLLRMAFGRKRAYFDEGHYAFEWFETNNDFQSFPSGHTTVAFALSTVFAGKIDNIWADIFFYTLAGLSAYERILNNVHWTSDVLLGGLIGYAAGRFSVEREKVRLGKESPAAGLNITPVPGGLNLTYQF